MSVIRPRTGDPTSRPRQNGFAQIAEGAAGFPGHSGHIPMENAAVAEVLREKGWNTFWLGKNHNVPVDEWSMGASKRNWPLARGFDRFYGFIGGETNNWYPNLVEDNHYIDQPYSPEEGYHLSKDLPDKGISFIRDSKQSAAEKPWFMWFCPGANHAPHHVPKDWADKYKGKFDDGYESDLVRPWPRSHSAAAGSPRSRSASATTPTSTWSSNSRPPWPATNDPRRR
jgi:arylsulfatase A-like enzyme